MTIDDSLMLNMVDFRFWWWTDGIKDGQSWLLSCYHDWKFRNSFRKSVWKLQDSTDWQHPADIVQQISKIRDPRDWEPKNYKIL